MDTVRSCDVGGIFFIRTHHQLLAQSTYLCQISLQLSFEAFCFLFRAGNKSLLLMDELFGGPDPLFKVLQFLSQGLKFSGSAAAISAASSSSVPVTSCLLK